MAQHFSAKFLNTVQNVSKVKRGGWGGGQGGGGLRVGGGGRRWKVDESKKRLDYKFYRAPLNIGS